MNQKVNIFSILCEVDCFVWFFLYGTFFVLVTISFSLSNVAMLVASRRRQQEKPPGTQ